MRRPRIRTTVPRYLFAAAASLCLMRCGGDRPSGPPSSFETPADPPAILITESERSGEALYQRESCGRCHTLLDRPGREGRGGRPSTDTDLLDSRVGPDLGLEGHRRSDEWHYAHLYAPGVLIPGSRMPASRHLFQPAGGRPVPTREARDLVAYLQALGRAHRDVWAERRTRDPDMPAPPPVDEALRRRGAELFAGRCAPCHGAPGDGRGALADFFSFPPRDFVSARYRFRSTPAGRPPSDGDLFRTITLGTGIGAAMPSFDEMPAEDRWALVLAVKEFSPELRGTGLRPAVEAPAPRPPKEDAAPAQAGRLSWERLGCASCHGASGRGMTREEARADWKDAAGVVVPRSGDLTHACTLRGGASPRAIDRALEYGVGDVMPSYAEAIGDGDTRRSLLLFVLSLQDERTMAEVPGAGGPTSPGTRSRPSPGPSPEP